jgi:DNA-binding transcriptional ArsR family regulator
VNSSAQLDGSFVALSHPARRAILARLAQGPATVGEATRELTLSKPAISKHLKVLEENGLLRRRVVGRTHRLRLEPRPLDEATRWIEQHRTVWETKLDAVEEWLSSD